MNIAHETMLLNVTIILAILASSAFTKIITKKEDCERMVKANLPNVSKIGDKDISQSTDVLCFDLAVDKTEIEEEGLLRASIGNNPYRFIAVDKEDASIIELYKAGGMEADLIHFGTVDGYDMYLWPEKLDVYTWNEVVDFFDFSINKSLVNRLKDMAAKKVYPKAKLPSAIYFNDDDGSIIFVSHNDLQRDDPQAVRSWMNELIAYLPEKQHEAALINPKKDQEIKEQKEKLVSFIKGVPADKNFLNEVSAYINKTEANTSPTGQRVNQKQGEKLATDAQNLLKGTELTKDLNQPKSDLTDIKLGLDKNGVPVKKDNSKTVSEKTIDDDFSYTPYIVGGIVVVGLISAVVAALLIRRKSTSGTARSGLIA